MPATHMRRECTATSVEAEESPIKGVLKRLGRHGHRRFGKPLRRFAWVFHDTDFH